MASRMHFFTFLMALAVLFALASAAQLEDSPVSEGAVVPEATKAPNKDLVKFSSDSLVAELLQRGVDPATNLLATANIAAEPTKNDQQKDQCSEECCRSMQND